MHPTRRSQPLAHTTLLALLAAVLCAAPFASGCSGEPEAAGAAEVPAAAAQALALRTRIDDGLSADTIRTLHVGHLAAVDLRGAPATFLVFTAPVAIEDAWSAAKALDRSQWAAAADDGPWSTTIVGATALRGRVSMTVRGLDLLAKVGKAAAAAGQVRRLVAATPVKYLLESAQGAFYDVDTAQPVDAATLQQLRDDYEAASTQLLQSGLAEALAPGWEPLLAGGHEGFSRGDGSLDTAKAAAALRDVIPTMQPRSGAGLVANATSQTRTCKKVLWWTECTTTEEGYFADPAAKQAHRAIQTRGYTMPGCFFTSTKSNTWQGCGPAALVSLVWREWANGASFSGLPTYAGGPTEYASYAYGAGAVERQLSQELPVDMGSCAMPYDQGTMTTPWGFVNGAQAWLQRHNPSYKLKSSTSYLLGNPFDGANKLSLLRARVGRDAGPVAALINLGWFAYHYTPVARYRSTSATDIQVQGFDEGQSTGGWYSLTDPWIAATGLYYLSK